MKEKLENLTPYITNFIKKEWKALHMMLLIGLDLIPFYIARTTYKQDPSVVEYGQLQNTIKSSEDNKSIEKVRKLLTHLMLENSVYSEAKLDHSELIISEKLLKSMNKKRLF